jgi:2-aminomuconate deaminase
VVLDAAGAGLEDLVDVTVFLTDMGADFDVMNRIYAEYLPAPGPARTTVEVASLPTQIAIELKCIAVLK